jgi:ABC-type multidrug transport system ATPase subunit
MAQPQDSRRQLANAEPPQRRPAAAYWHRRAFLKNAPVLLLDEPTSALDSGTEQAIMKTIAELMRGRTTLIITHRVSTAHNLGHVVVLEAGCIVEQGTGPELLAALVVCTALPGTARGSYERNIERNPPLEDTCAI